VAAGLIRIVEAILRGEHTVLSVSNLVTQVYAIAPVDLCLPAVSRFEVPPVTSTALLVALRVRA